MMSLKDRLTPRAIQHPLELRAGLDSSGVAEMPLAQTLLGCQEVSEKGAAKKGTGTKDGALFREDWCAEAIMTSAFVEMRFLLWDKYFCSAHRSC